MENIAKNIKNKENTAKPSKYQEHLRKLDRERRRLSSKKAVRKALTRLLTRCLFSLFFRTVFDEIVGRFARVLTRFLARVLSGVLGMENIIIAMHSTTRPEEKA